MPESTDQNHGKNSTSEIILNTSSCRPILFKCRLQLSQICNCCVWSNSIIHRNCDTLLHSSFWVHNLNRILSVIRKTSGKKRCMKIHRIIYLGIHWNNFIFKLARSSCSSSTPMRFNLFSQI